MLTAGEPLLPDLAARLLENCGTLWNLYGPTETTIYSTGERIDRADRRIVSIGRPVANTQHLPARFQLQPVPTGITGEIYIGGDGLARGYLNRPDLTAEQFIPDPFSNKPGARLYKTGDRGPLPCRTAGSTIIGRIDRQMKLRGFRIELGEIESVLRQHSGVKECVVALTETGNKRLIAYDVAKRDHCDWRR